MTTLRISGVLLALVLCAASASAPKKRTIEKTASVTGSYDETWLALSALADERKWAMTTNDKASGTIATDWMNLVDTSHTDCGVHALASKDRDPRYRLQVRLERNGPQTTVTVDAAFQKIRMFDDAGRQIDCASKGTLERQIFTELNTRVKLAGIQREKEAAEAAKAPFYCVVTWCARNEADCESRREELAKTAAGFVAPPCTKAQTAVCFIGMKEGVHTESCHTSRDACAEHRKAAQMTDAGECS